MIRTLIVDDETLCRNELKYLLSRHADINIEKEADNMNQAQQYLQAHDIDLLFLDIQMDETNTGLKIAQQISTQKKPPLIIFVTAHPQYAFKAYDYLPLHYLLKPVAEKKLDFALQRARDILAAETRTNSESVYEKMVDVVHSMVSPKKIAIKYKYQNKYNDTIRPTVYLTVNEILFIHKDILSNTTKVYTVDGQQYEGVRKTLQEFEDQLVDNGFFRIHRSFLVTLHYVRGQKPQASGEEKYLLLLKGSSLELPISKLKISALIATLESSN